MKEIITILGVNIEVENVPYESVKPMPPKPIKMLICCCCGQYTEGRQWWNRDTGYGLCNSCADRINQTEDQETMKSSYGEKGVHYYIKRGE